METDLLEQRGTLSTEDLVGGIRVDQLTEAGHGIVPEASHGIPQNALPVAGEVDGRFHKAGAEFTALDDPAGDDILRRGFRIANGGDIPAILHFRFEGQPEILEIQRVDARMVRSGNQAFMQRFDRSGVDECKPNGQRRWLGEEPA